MNERKYVGLTSEEATEIISVDSNRMLIALKDVRLTSEEVTKRSYFLDLQADTQPFFSQQNFDRLKESARKMNEASESIRDAEDQ